MDNTTIKNICAEVYKKHPAFAGCQPEVKELPDCNILLVFKKSSVTENGFQISRTLRVCVNREGVILKISESK